MLDDTLRRVETVVAVLCSSEDSRTTSLRDNSQALRDIGHVNVTGCAAEVA